MISRDLGSLFLGGSCHMLGRVWAGDVERLLRSLEEEFRKMEVLNGEASIVFGFPHRKFYCLFTRSFFPKISRSLTYHNIEIRLLYTGDSKI